MYAPQRLLQANFIKKHMASQTHKTNVKIAHCRDSEIPLAIQNIQKEVEEQFPQVFIPKTKLVVCRICSTELLLLHKVVLNNVKQHVNSTCHRQRVGTFGKPGLTNDISSFLFKQGKSAENSRLSGQGNSFVLDFIKTVLYINWTISL